MRGGTRGKLGMNRRISTRHEIKAVDKIELLEYIRQQNARDGFVPDPAATGEHTQAMMRALGIRPEDNIGPCGITASRDIE